MTVLLTKPPTNDLAEAAQEAFAKIEETINTLLVAEVNLNTARINIGLLLNQVRQNQYWKLGGFASFNDYMESLETKFNRGRTQLFAYAGLCRDLLPDVSAERLSEMGLEKAKLIQQARKATGTLPKEEILLAATDEEVSVKDFRQMLLDNKKLPNTPQDGRHYSIEYFANADQQKTISDALESAIRTGGGILCSSVNSGEVRTGIALESMGMVFLAEYPLEAQNEF